MPRMTREPISPSRRKGTLEPARSWVWGQLEVRGSVLDGVEAAFGGEGTWGGSVGSRSRDDGRSCRMAIFVVRGG